MHWTEPATADDSYAALEKKLWAAGVIYLPENARFAELLSLPEGANTGQAINDAMRAIEENPDLSAMLPKTYHILDSRPLAQLEIVA